MKKYFLEKLKPCCRFDYRMMRKFINSVELINGEDSRLTLLKAIMPNGNLTPDGWQLLVGEVVLIEGSEIAPEEVTEWFGECYVLTCDQWILLVENFKYLESGGGSVGGIFNEVFSNEFA